MFRVVTKSENTSNINNKSTATLPDKKKTKNVEQVEPDQNKIDLRYKPDPYMQSVKIEPYNPITIETKKKEIENQIIIYDKNTNEWKVINESDSYLYNT